MHAKDPTKLRVRDLQPTVRRALVYLPIPYHEVSLTVFVLEYGAEESAAFQVTPRSKLPRLTLVYTKYDLPIKVRRNSGRRSLPSAKIKRSSSI